MRRVAGSTVVPDYERLLEPGTVAGLTERQVIARFVESSDPVAFEAIVRRHGPMVFSLCRQLLRDPNDVDDAFQATFLILLKKARTLRQPERLGPWLYGVAYRVARRARSQPRPRTMDEDRAAPPAGCPMEERERVAAIYDEIQHLPEKYRLPVVLCCLEGLSHDEAAGQLGWPVGTVHGRLSRAREQLKSRLARRDITHPARGALALDFLQPARAALPESLTRSTVALLIGTVPAHLEYLVKGALAAMILTKIKLIGLSLLVAVVGLAVATTAVLAYQGAAADTGGRPDQAVVAETNPPQKADSPTRKTSDDRAAIVANGKLAGEAAPNEGELIELERLKVKAEFLEEDVQQERTAIVNQKQWLKRLQSERPATDAGPTDEVIVAKRQKQHTQEVERVTMELQETRESYERNRIELGRLKRQIARMSKGLAEDKEPAGSMASLAHRLDRIEQKLDQLIEGMGRKNPQ
jgi:RNA polymerase sigma factor (sigma-70 family)